MNWSSLVALRTVLVAPLEDAQRDPTARATPLVEHVADVERDDLVLSKRRTEGDREDEMVPKAITVLTGDP